MMVMCVDSRPAAMDRSDLMTVPPRNTPGSLEDRSDDDLMLLAAAGRDAAFEQLVQRHMPGLLRYCCKQVCDARLGEEIAQDSWLKLWAYRLRYQPLGKFRILLYTTARNCCRSHARGSGRRSRWFSDLSAPTETTHSADSSQLEMLLEQENATRIQASLATLKPKLREALLLRYDQDLDYSEIAIIVGRSESTVRSRIFHALKKLRIRISGEMP